MTIHMETRLANQLLKKISVIVKTINQRLQADTTIILLPELPNLQQDMITNTIGSQPNVQQDMTTNIIGSLLKIHPDVIFHSTGYISNIDYSSINFLINVYQQFLLLTLVATKQNAFLKQQLANNRLYLLFLRNIEMFVETETASTIQQFMFLLQKRL